MNTARLLLSRMDTNGLCDNWNMASQIRMAFDETFYNSFNILKVVAVSFFASRQPLGIACLLVLPMKILSRKKRGKGFCPSISRTIAPQKQDVSVVADMMLLKPSSYSRNDCRSTTLGIALKIRRSEIHQDPYFTRATITNHNDHFLRILTPHI